MLGNYDASLYYQKKESNLDNAAKVITEKEYNQRKERLLKS